MAEDTKLLAVYEGRYELWMTFDDALAVYDGEGLLIDYSVVDLVSFRIVIEAGVTVHYELWRSQNRNPWRTGELSGPLDETINAGGPIRTFDDIGHIAIGADS